MRTYGLGVMLGLLALLMTCPACGRGGGDAMAPGPSRAGDSLEESLANSLELLLQQKGVDPQRFASMPVSGESNRVKDISLGQDDDERYIVTWHYRNSGDYNQDGTVAISDITQLAMHFGEEVGEDDNSISAVVDGDNSTKVDIGDITPIAINYGAEVAGYMLQTAENAGGDFNDFDTVYLAEMVASNGRLRAEYPLSSINLPVVRVVPFDSQEADGIVSQEFAIELAAPTITAVRPLTCEVGKAVTYRADLDAEGQCTYYWEFGENALPSISENEQPTVIMTQVGEQECNLAVATPFGEDSTGFTVSVVAAGAEPYITSVQPQSCPANTEITFSARVGGAEPIAYGWDFSDAATPPTSSDDQPAVMVGDPGEYTVTLTVENAFGSDTYQYSLHVVEGLDLQVLEIRIRLEGATNTLVEDPNYGTDRFRTRIGEGTAEGEAYASDSAHGYLDAIKYLHIPEDLMYGYDQAPPEGQADAFEATLSYLSTRLDWRISCAGYEPEELFTHDPFEEAGHLRGYFGAVEDIYIVDAWLPEGILGVPSEPVEVTIALDVTEAG